MSTFRANDKVVCIDATPLPRYCPREYTTLDCSFPGGYIEEGAIYCVADVGLGGDGHAALRLVGKPIFLLDTEVTWNGQRFRKIEHHRQTQRRSVHQQQPCGDIPDLAIVHSPR